MNVRCDSSGKCNAPEKRIIEADVSLIRLCHDVENYLYWTDETGSPIIDPDGRWFGGDLVGRNCLVSTACRAIALDLFEQARRTLLRRSLRQCRKLAVRWYLVASV
jgi:hypothetical protein